MTLSSKLKIKPRHKFSFEALGTQWVVETEGAMTLSIENKIRKRLDVYDHAYSRFKDDSLVSRLLVPGVYQFPDDFKILFQMYKDCFELTNGKMTPLIGGMLEDSGYDKSYSLTPKHIRPIPQLNEEIEWDGATTIISSQPVIFDVGAIGKGHAVDIIAELLEGNNIYEYVIDASGDIKHHDTTAERIGLEHPNDPSKIIGYVDIEKQSLCASAVNRRKWHDFHHIMDPMTRRPVDDVVATWVVADETIIADAMATALFFVTSPSQLMQAYPFTYVRMFSDGTVDQSTDFKGKLFI